MPDLIFHHYPQSPVSEKVRVVFGMKGLTWRSVVIPRVPPKPLYYPLTGGYRRTPALQIGADVYCDSRCIIGEIDRRFPEPSITPGGGQGMVWAVGQWSDGPLFDLVLRVIFAVTYDDMPEEFARDRGALYFGDPQGLKDLKSELPRNLAQLRGHLSWIDDRLSKGRDFMLGDAPGIPDALCYYLTWMMAERWPEYGAFVSEFPHLSAWQTRVKSIGHGASSGMSAEDALAEARAAVPQTDAAKDPNDPLGIEPGDEIAIMHLGKGEDPPVRGRFVSGGPDRIAVSISNDQAGDLCLHFPKVGYRIEKV